MRLEEIRSSEIPDGFSYGFYHGHNDQSIRSGQMYPQGKKLIFLAFNHEEAGQYGRYVHKIAVRQGIKSVDLTYLSKESVRILDKMQKELKDSKIKALIADGKLWRNKPLERRVIGWLIKEGYQKIKILDETSEEDPDMTDSMIIVNPHENCYVV